MSEARPFSPPEPLRSAFAACRRHFLFAGAFSAFVNLLYLTPTVYLMQVYDRVLPTGGMATLVWMSLLALAAFTVLGLLNAIRTRILIRAGVRLEKRIAPEILTRVFAAHGERGSLKGLALRDFDSFRQMMTGQGFIALMDAPWTPIYILASFIIHPWVGVLTLFSSVLLLGLAVLNERATRGVMKDAGEAMARAHMMQDSLGRRADVIRALGMRKALSRLQLTQRAEGVDLQSLAGLKSAGYSSLITATRLMVQSAVLGLAVILAVRGEITAGAIIAASLLMGRALAPIDQLVRSWSGFIQGRQAYQKLIELFTDETRGVESLELPRPAGRLQVSELEVEPVPGRKLLEDVSFQVGAGEIVGVIGPSGSGKTTLLSAIARARPHTRGSIRLDGASLEDWEPDRLGRLMGYLPQDSALLAGTIRDNISRFSVLDGGEDAEIDAAVIKAAKKAGAHDLILQLPGAYGATLGPGGLGLSAGQAQRVALARALYGDPVLLLLDEPNAHLDLEGQMALMNALKVEKDAGTTVLIAAHRSNALAFADHLLILRQGRVEAFGRASDIAARMKAASPISSAVRTAQ